MGTTVTLTEAVLFAVLGSNSFSVALAVLVSVPEPVGVTVMVALAEAFTASVAKVHVTVVVPVHAGLAEENVAPPGSVSVIFTPVAGDGPLFVTVSV
jgi:hypothetical protein